MFKRSVLLFVLALLSFNVSAVPTFPALNKDGTIVTGILTAAYDPLGGVFPFPFNLLYLGTTDGTLNPPVEDPTNFGDPTVALSAMDGFSTTERWVTSFVDANGNPGQIDPGSVVAGESVRVFQVVTQDIVVPTGIIRELTPQVDYTAAVIAPGVIAIIPLRPLQELSSFLAVLTNDINDADGNDATPDQTYYLTQRRTPWVDANGNSTYSLIPDAQAQALEPQRQITNAMEAVAAAGGVNRDDIILSWTVQTQSITPVTKLLRSVAQPAPTTMGPTGISTGNLGLAGLANLYAGVITLPYYLGVPSAQNPTAPLTDFWTAEPGAYIPPFDQLGFDPTSTNVTVFNPFPVLTDMQTVPILATAPNANTGLEKPAAGWPTVIVGHGLRGNRTQMLALADTLASVGFAAIAIDAPLHGITPQDAALAPLYIENTPFADDANERTFNVDYVNNQTGAPGPDGVVDASGTHIINLASMLTSRDNARQMNADLSVLAVTIPYIDIDGDTLPDLDGSNVHYLGVSMGAILGTPFVAVEPTLTSAVLSVGMGGIARGLNASQTIGPSIRAGLAANGVVEGTAEFEQFFTVFQTVIDSMDPVNWGAEAAFNHPILFHEVIGDTVVPNGSPTAPLSGTEPLLRVMGLTSYSTTQADPAGLRVAGRFVPPASHGSIADPSSSPAATIEMQSQAASFILSDGEIVVVTDESTMVPIPQLLGDSQPLVIRPERGAYGRGDISPQNLNNQSGRPQ